MLHFLYRVCKYRRDDHERRVAFCPSSLQFACSCERFELFGILCEHLLAVLICLDIVILSETLVLGRWTRAAKDSIPLPTFNKKCHDPMLIGQ